MGSVDRGLIKPAGSRCPMTRDRCPSIRRLTDDAITLVHPRKSCVSQLLLFAVAGVIGVMPSRCLGIFHLLLSIVTVTFPSASDLRVSYAL